jgi:ATP-binding cassette subfamily F protein uup
LSSLISCHQISKSFGSRTLFSQITVAISRGQHIGLIGPNGSGKSTLLKVLAGLESPDEGTIAYQRSLRIGYVAQDSVLPEESVEEVLLHAILDEDPRDAHERQTAVRILMGKLGFMNPSQLANTLSGGWKKRLEIARELIKSPDVLFLDEPTNHLDLEGIEWLESFLEKQTFAYLVISHDRYFLERVATRTIELNKTYANGLFSVEGSYNTFIEKREEFLLGQQQYQRSLASKVRGEVEWLKKSPQARTTKAQARIQEAERLVDELSTVQARNKKQVSQIDFEATERQTQKLIAVKNLAKSMQGRLLFSGVSFVLSPGSRLGVVGTNGCGKSTLLKMLAGQGTPDRGTLKAADDLKIVYFDQHRIQLSPEESLRHALSPTGDYVNYRGKSIHVSGWAKRFLFPPEKLDLPLGQFSGGERARILIARLMLQPADVLLLDEPTNDLDIPTLEILEESLAEFPGALVLITHDRYLLDRLCTRVLGLGTETDTILFADYHQWEKAKSERATKGVESKKESVVKSLDKPRPAAAKLTYQERRDLEQMEEKIEKMEEEVARLHHEMEAFNDPAQLQEMCGRLSTAQAALEALYARWQELEVKKNEA